LAAKPQLPQHLYTSSIKHYFVELKSTELTMAKDQKIDEAIKEQQKEPEEKPACLPEMEELLNLLKRTQANFENYRKQTEKRIEEIRSMASQDIILQVLPVLDNFELAFKTAQKNEQNKELLQGMELIYAQLFSILENNGIKIISTKDQKFDLYLHEALIKEPSEKPENTILEEFQKGYTLNYKVIRHAKVKISSGKKMEMVNKMKTIQEARDEYVQCPKGHTKENFSFVNENVYCEKCDAHYDLGMKKYKD